MHVCISFDDDQSILKTKHTNLFDNFFSFSETVHRNSVPRNVNMKEEEMRNFVEQLIAGSEQWKAMKLVVLGNGRIGKTTLLRAFDQLLPGSSQKVFC